MTEPVLGPKPAAWMTILAALLPVLAQALALLNPDFVVVDCEERFNAAHAVSLVNGHLDALLDLQYRKFCGGCTFTAAMAAGFMSVLPPTFLTWKLVPLSFTALAGAVGFRALWRRSSPLAGALFVALLCLAPAAWIRLALLAWGNHYEAGVWCLMLWALATGPLSNRAHILVGAFAGGTIWFGFSSVYAVVGFALLRLLQGRHRALLWFGLGALLAPALWVAQFLETDQHPFDTIYVKGEFVPNPLRLPYKLKTLLWPQQWAGLFAVSNVAIGVPLGLAWALSALTAIGTGVWAGWRARDRLPAEAIAAAWLVVWLFVYLVVEFKLELRPWPDVPSAAGVRYYAPIVPLLLVVVSSVAARWWTGGHPRRAAALLAGPLACGLVAKAAVLSPPFPNTYVADLDAPDHENFRYVNSYALDPRGHEACPGEDIPHQAAHAYALGRHTTLGILPNTGRVLTGLQGALPPEEHFYEGVGSAVIDHLDTDAQGNLSTLEGAERMLKGLDADAAAAALDEVVWWRAFRPEPFGYARGLAGETAPVVRLLGAAQNLSPGLREDVLRSMGRKWGIVLGRWGQPGAVPFPTTDKVGLGDFAFGYGEGLGTKWGPWAQVPAPTGMAEEFEDAFQEGYQRGVARQWRAPRRAPELIRGSTPDPAADRWWGPAPTMYCPCRATCW